MKTIHIKRRVPTGWQRWEQSTSSVGYRQDDRDENNPHQSTSHLQRVRGAWQGGYLVNLKDCNVEGGEYAALPGTVLIKIKIGKQNDNIKYTVRNRAYHYIKCNKIIDIDHTGHRPDNVKIKLRHPRKRWSLSKEMMLWLKINWTIIAAPDTKMISYLSSFEVHCLLFFCFKEWKRKICSLESINQIW